MPYVDGKFVVQYLFPSPLPSEFTSFQFNPATTPQQRNFNKLMVAGASQYPFYEFAYNYMFNSGSAGGITSQVFTQQFAAIHGDLFSSAGPYSYPALVNDFSGGGNNRGLGDPFPVIPNVPPYSRKPGGSSFQTYIQAIWSYVGGFETAPKHGSKPGTIAPGPSANPGTDLTSSGANFGPGRSFVPVAVTIDLTDDQVAELEAGATQIVLTTTQLNQIETQQPSGSSAGATVGTVTIPTSINSLPTIYYELGSGKLSPFNPPGGSNGVVIIVKLINDGVSVSLNDNTGSSATIASWVTSDFLNPPNPFSGASSNVAPSPGQYVCFAQTKQGQANSVNLTVYTGDRTIVGPTPPAAPVVVPTSFDSTGPIGAGSVFTVYVYSVRTNDPSTGLPGLGRYSVGSGGGYVATVVSGGDNSIALFDARGGLGIPGALLWDTAAHATPTWVSWTTTSPYTFTTPRTLIWAIPTPIAPYTPLITFQIEQN